MSRGQGTVEHAGARGLVGAMKPVVSGLRKLIWGKDARWAENSYCGMGFPRLRAIAQDIKLKGNDYEDRFDRGR